MSTALAIAATTAVIKTLINTSLVKANLTTVLGDSSVSALPPDRVETGELEKSRLNLFMYQATTNANWRNAAMPSRDASGERLMNPPLTLDLHYMLSAYGKEELQAEILLGIGMQVLHEMPILTREAIRSVFNPPSGPPSSDIMRALGTSGLADQVELIKISPHTMSSEEISRLWSAFQDKYRPTAAYLATVVLIQARASTRTAPPVRERKVEVVPLRRPTIDAVEPQTVPGPSATITLRGHELLAPDTTAVFGNGVEQTPGPKSTEDALVVTLPADLAAGLNTVQVVMRLSYGPPSPHKGFESNIAAFMLRPTITRKTVGGSQVYDISIANPQGTGNDPRSADVTIALDPPIGKKQEVLLLMNELNAPAGRPANAYTFPALSREADVHPTSPQATFPVRSVAKGDYLARVRVDGAETVVDVDSQGKSTAPRVSLP